MRLSLALTFIRKDWTEFRKPIAVMTTGLLAPVFMFWLGTNRPDFVKGLIAGALMAGPFLYAHSCFFMERQAGTLSFLLALPITRNELVFAKYASVFSMTLFSVNVPGILLGDLRLLFYANAVSLFLTTVFMAATIVSDKPWAPMLPFWLVIVLALPIRPLLERFAWIAAHYTLLAVIALALIPVIVLTSAYFFRAE